MARCHASIRQRRLNFCHHLSKSLVASFDLIAFERLNIRGIVRSRLARAILDAARGLLLFQVAYKAEEAGRYAVAVNPRGTSQLCSECAALVRKPLSERMHRLVLPRDQNAARNILALGRRAVGLPPSVRN